MDELESNIKTLLTKNKVKFRSISVEEDKLILGIEGNKDKYFYVLPRLKSLGLTPINLVYGRWVFKINNS